MGQCIPQPCREVLNGKAMDIVMPKFCQRVRNFCWLKGNAPQAALKGWLEVPGLFFPYYCCSSQVSEILWPHSASSFGQ